MPKALVCSRGHDTSSPDARYRSRQCKACKTVATRRHMVTYKANHPDRVAKSNQVYNQTQGRQISRYSQYKKNLSTRISYKRLQLEGLIKHVQEIFNRNGTPENR